MDFKNNGVGYNRGIGRGFKRVLPYPISPLFAK
jgi:hypothetical protein